MGNGLQWLVLVRYIQFKVIETLLTSIQKNSSVIYI